MFYPVLLQSRAGCSAFYMHPVGIFPSRRELFMRSYQTTQIVDGLEVIRRGHVVGVRKDNGSWAFQAAVQRRYHFCSEAVSRLYGRTFPFRRFRTVSANISRSSRRLNLLEVIFQAGEYLFRNRFRGSLKVLIVEIYPAVRDYGREM
jgi:hypothetical protein